MNVFDGFPPVVHPLRRRVPDDSCHCARHTHTFPRVRDRGRSARQAVWLTDGRTNEKLQKLMVKILKTNQISFVVKDTNLVSFKQDCEKRRENCDAVKFLLSTNLVIGIILCS